MTQQTVAVTEAHEHRSRFRPTLWHLSLLLVVAGLIVSGYLSYVKLTDEPMVCVANSIFNCGAVQNSAYSRFLGIPIAYMGFGVYVILGALLLLERRSPFVQVNGKLMATGLNLFAWVFSMWLVYVQFVILEALCMWCLMHELIITILFIVNGLRLWREWQTT